MSNKLYDILKYVQRIALPAVATLIGAISKSIGWDATTVISIIIAVDVFLGSILQYESIKYQEAKDEQNSNK